MTDYPIENCTKQTLWFDIKYFDNQRVYIYTSDQVDSDNAGGYMPIEPGETIVLHMNVNCGGFHIEDKDGNHV